MKTLIVIPARMGSTRFPGKPLHQIAGKSLLMRVVDIAHAACEADQDRSYVVATDHDDIAAHCHKIEVPVVLTDPALPSGTDRALAAANQYTPDAEFIVNLQGDAPFTPPSYIDRIIEVGRSSNFDLVTPIVEVSWDQLDVLRQQKSRTPFSGTSCVVGLNDEALWFSKTILPAIRKEADLRAQSDTSPVLRHIGLYGYKRAALERFVALPEGYYEKLEGLEQLRFLENGMRIQAVRVPATNTAMWGIDTPEDAAYAEQLLAGKN